MNAPIQGVHVSADVCSYCGRPGHTIRSCETFAAKHPDSPMATRCLHRNCVPDGSVSGSRCADCGMTFSNFIPQGSRSRIPLEDSAPDVSESVLARELRSLCDAVRALRETPVDVAEGGTIEHALRSLYSAETHARALLSPRKVGP